MIIIVSPEADLHALAVQREFLIQGRSDCLILPVDRLANNDALLASIGAVAETEIRVDGRTLRPADAQVVWWRRTASANNNQEPLDRFVTAQCQAALRGVFALGFHGTWISHPDATDRAANKILQLDVALRAGFRVPRTIVTQSKQQVEEFYSACGGKIIAKPLASVSSPMLVTAKVDKLDDIDAAAIAAAPTICQELIEGTRHLRLNIFGDRVFGAIIESTELDWRPNLNVPIYATEVPAEIQDRAQVVLREFGLAMGIFDLKQTPDGDWVWLEVNPQGQFLFLEPLTGQPLAHAFAEFLLASCDSTRTQ